MNLDNLSAEDRAVLANLIAKASSDDSGNSCRKRTVEYEETENQTPSNSTANTKAKSRTSKEVLVAMKAENQGSLPAKIVQIARALSKPEKSPEDLALLEGVAAALQYKQDNNRNMVSFSFLIVYLIVSSSSSVPLLSSLFSIFLLPSSIYILFKKLFSIFSSPSFVLSLLVWLFTDARHLYIFSLLSSLFYLEYNY
jgi:hypothetical protein